MADLQDEDGVKVIQEFVRANKDIEFTDYIKRGNNGEVYFGKRNKLGDDIAMKFYWTDNADYDATEEAVILKGINHNNILKIYDLRFLPPYYAYFLTPRISGGDLQELIDQNKLTSKSALEIVAGILLGLNELHSTHKLVHRDLKPGNILINLPDNRPIIADLGAVKKIDAANGHVTASKSAYLYLPPEAILHNQYYFQSDIYQVGLIMFQLLGGKFHINEPTKWFSAREIKKLESIRDQKLRAEYFNSVIANRIVKGVLADTKNGLPAHLDLSFKRVLNKALNVDHQKRYKNAAQFLTDVHQLIRNFPDYSLTNDQLLIHHGNGKQFRIKKDKAGKHLVEKRIGAGDWRKEKKHNGTLDSVLSLARSK